MKLNFCHVFVVGFSLFITASCGTNKTDQSGSADAQIVKTDSMKTLWARDGNQDVFLYTLRAANGARVRISNYGGTITEWLAPDKMGNLSSVVMGMDSLADYLKNPPYFGALIGRYGNRIAHAKFTLDGVAYKLAANNGVNSLHGGIAGFDKVLWIASDIKDSTSITFNYISHDGEEGYPGNLKVAVKYTLAPNNELTIEYNAETDKPTPVNLTNHSYFNLTGSPGTAILNHSMHINADHYTPVDTSLIPTGEIAAVKGTPFDFTKSKLIGADIDKVKGGYDHNFVINRHDSSLQFAAEITDSLSGRQLKVYTTEPGLQFYTGNFMDGKFTNHDGKPLNFRTAFCVETQHFPDSPNQPKFPSTILRPGQHYHSITKYALSVIPAANKQ